MALSTNSAWDAIFNSGTIEPVLRLVITSTSSSFTFWSGPTDTIADNDFPPPVYHQQLINVGSTMRSFDPFTRKMSVGSINFQMVADDYVRDMVTTEPLRGKSVEITLGAKGITSTSNFLPYFKGLIEDIVSVNDGTAVEFRCRTIEAKLLRRKWFGYYHQSHPLEVIENLLTQGLVSADLIDDASLDPSVDTGKSHFVVNLSQRTASADQSAPEPQDIAATIDEMLLIMGGSLVAQENGKLTYTSFDSSTASTVDFTENDIDRLTVTSMYSKLVNRCVVRSHFANKGAEYWSFGGEPSLAVEQNDEDSQDRFKFKGTASADTSDELWLNLETVSNSMLLTASITDVSTSIAMISSGGVCGTRWSGFPGGSQDSNATISSSRKLYLRIEDVTKDFEIVECNALSIDTTQQTAYPVTDAQYPYQVLSAATPRAITATASARGAWDTTAKAYNSDQFILARDITIPINVVQRFVERWANGAPRIKITTSLRYYYVQVGDLVTVTSDRIVWFGHDGVTTAIKWEVVGKKVDVTGSNPMCEFDLYFAVQTSPPSVSLVGESNIFISRLRASANAGGTAAREEVIRKHVSSGFDISTSTLQATVSEGIASAVAVQAVVNNEYIINVNASKDTYLIIDVFDGGMSALEFANSSSTPDVATNEILLYKLISNGSTITDVVDFRPLTSVSGIKLISDTYGPRTTEEGWSVNTLTLNREFNNWTYPNSLDGTPPDNWQIVQAASASQNNPDYTNIANDRWGSGNNIYYSTTSATGGYSVSIDSATEGLTSGIMAIAAVPVDLSKFYYAEARLQESNTNVVPYVGLIEYDVNGDYVTNNEDLHTASAINTWEQFRKFIELNSSTRFVRAWAYTRDSGSGTLLIDRLEVTAKSLEVRAIANSTTSLPYNTATKLNIDNTASASAYDPYAQWDTTNKNMTVKSAGVYDISAGYEIQSAASTTTIILYLYVNNVLNRTKTQKNPFNATSNFRIDALFRGISLAEGDVIDIRGNHDESPGSLTASSGGDTTFIEVQES